MRTVKLTIKDRETPNISVEAECIVPKNFVGDGWKSLTVWEGNREILLTDFFDLEVAGDAQSAEDVEIILCGESLWTVKRVGEYMDGGKITVEGNIGMHCGNFMSDGFIEIKGNADGWLGREMNGGKILCHGDASHYCGAGYRGVKTGMKGGVLEVMGNAGDYCGECLAGGELIIRGSCGDMAGVDMKGGRFVVCGDCVRPCGNMKDGVAEIHGKAYQMPPAFSYEGEEVIDGTTFSVFKGDVANRGKGLLKVAEYEYY
ncbi:MAG: formylmethanofuran dehydrogenase subunit C [Methanomicrobium sp.]|nr:formylmethanofuran dehydrogenase subunit C [Methanomicrobium sp.]